MNWKDVLEEVVPEFEVMTFKISWRGRGKPRSFPIVRASDREEVGTALICNERQTRCSLCRLSWCCLVLTWGC
jgi:hypothetical protein